jgi:endonuclease-3 related protein
VQSKARNPELQIRKIYQALLRAWGPQHWWPAQSRFEVIVGAYLTQNTAWTNVERAMANLRADRALSLDAIRQLPLGELEKLIRPAGYFRQKAARLKRFIEFLDSRYAGSLAQMFAQPTEKLRTELLALTGVGRETADSILLYAGNHPVFVVDAYTRRVLHRHRILPANADYDEARSLVERALGDLPAQATTTSPSPLAHLPSRMSRATRSAAAQHFNEMHGLLVCVGKLHCRKADPECDGCPLACFLNGCKPAV